LLLLRRRLLAGIWDIGAGPEAKGGHTGKVGSFRADRHPYCRPGCQQRADDGDCVTSVTP
jgi:hypothetical protein